MGARRWRWGGDSVESLQPFKVVIRQERAHLGDGDFIELEQAFRLGQSLTDQHGVEAFEIGQDDELLQRGVVTEIALGVGVGVAPLPGGLAKEGHVQQVSLVGIDETGLGLGDGRRNECFLDGIGMDAVVDLGQGALEVPAKLEAGVFFFFEPLELLDEIELELDRDPGSEFKGDVLVGVGAAVAARSGDQPDGGGRINPSFGGQDEAIESRLFFNPIEFDGIKTGVVELLPDAEEFDGVAVAEPVGDEVVRPFGVFVAGDVGKAEVVLPVFGKHGDGCALDRDAGAFGLTHDCGIGLEFVPNPSNSTGLIVANSP